MRASEREAEGDDRARAGGAGFAGGQREPGGPAPLGAGAVQRLQGTAGNRALSRLLAGSTAGPGGVVARPGDAAGPLPEVASDVASDRAGSSREGAEMGPVAAAPPSGGTAGSTPETSGADAPRAGTPVAETSPVEAPGAAGPTGAAVVERGARLAEVRTPAPVARPGENPLRELRDAHLDTEAPQAPVTVESPPPPRVAPHQPPTVLPRVAFADTDVDALLPEAGPGFRPERRAEVAVGIGDELAADRVSATASVDAFVAARRARSAEVTALRAELAERVTASGATAGVGIERAANDRVDAVRAAVREVRAQLRAGAERARAQVEGDHAASLAAIRAATEDGRARIRGASTAAAGRTGIAESAQLTRLGGLYARVEGQFRAVGHDAGVLAVEQAAARAAQYRAGRIDREDSLLDGHLTDNRCDAQAEAAEKVGAAYRDGLTQEAVKQVEALRGRRSTDEAVVRKLAGDTRDSLGVVAGQAVDGLAGTEAQSSAGARAAKASVLDAIGETLRTAEAALARHESAQVAAIRSQAQRQRQAVARSAESAVAALDRTVEHAVADTDSGVAALVERLGAAGVPDPDSLAGALRDAGGQLDDRFTLLVADLRERADQVGQGLSAHATAATDTIERTGDAATAAARRTGAGAGQALSTARERGAEGFGELASGHRRAVDSALTGHDTAVTAVLGGMATGFDTLAATVSDGAARQVEAVRDGLTASVVKDLPGAITTEAAKAREQVQPRWKSVLKWVVVIAVVLLAAVVLGPLVIGAVTGAAAALGASAGAAGLIGMVVGGALVGAGTSAATTVVDNAFAGRDLMTGIGTAIAVGALGGALGGAASGLLAGPLQGMSALARYGAQVAVDAVVDTGINAATGNLTWEAFATGLLMSALVNGVTAHPRVQGFQHNATSRSYGAAFEATTGLSGHTTSRSGPRGPVTVDHQHVNVGDTASPSSPYRNTWDMQGGGHNATAIRARAAREGITSTSVDVDPVTGVAVEKFSRPALNSSGNTIPDATAPGGVQVRVRMKSLFPESMGEAEIAKLAAVALERARAGAPQTSHTAPGTNANGSPMNGSFSAVVVTPDGHPIRVEGYYAQGPGGLEIKTAYPATDVANARVSPVPGSQVSVPGGVFTPPDYDAGD
ncbi:MULTISPECIES: hypothetical protein [Actinosynnema]|uniref:hypothetical protein n=1 Tax=Actinosynnema TaxID=40566 RepID=UPI0020A5AE2A|nr:hypothetical protein [Actinosynnema pretiosum]MCP2094342.1 hypothetical protein [Actinosynnema pretiosum]